MCRTPLKCLFCKTFRGIHGFSLLNLPGPLFALFTGSSGEAEVQFVKYTPDGTVLEFNIIRGMGFTTTGIVKTGQRVYFETISGIDKIYYYEK